jgi:hypothetical protein
MLPTLPLRKLVIELRYKPELTFYSRMDAVGTALADDFPDWQRSPLTVEVRNKKKHRRVFLTHQRCFYETDLAPAGSVGEFEFAQKTLLDVCSGLSVKDLKRLGVRQWFASDVDKSFAVMVDEVTSRFLNRSSDLSAILTDKPRDVGYVVDYETPDGWRYHLRLGPMTKEEWFQTIHYEGGIFEAAEEEDPASLQQYRKTIPENFLFVDIDCYKDNVSTVDFRELLTTFRRRSQEIVDRLIRYCRG